MDAFLFELSHELQNALTLAAILLTGFYLALWLTITLAVVAWHAAGRNIADKITRHQIKQAKQSEQNAYTQARKALTKQDELAELRSQMGLTEEP